MQRIAAPRRRRKRAHPRGFAWQPGAAARSVAPRCAPADPRVSRAQAKESMW